MRSMSNSSPYKSAERKNLWSDPSLCMESSMERDDLYLSDKTFPLTSDYYDVNLFPSARTKQHSSYPADINVIHPSVIDVPSLWLKNDRFSAISSGDSVEPWWSLSAIGDDNATSSFPLSMLSCRASRHSDKCLKTIMNLASSVGYCAVKRTYARRNERERERENTHRDLGDIRFFLVSNESCREAIEHHSTPVSVYGRDL